MRRVISSSLSPNAESSDVALAFRTLVTPWLWKTGEAVERVEAWFRIYFQTQTVASFNSGRSAMFALLKSFGIAKGDEVIVQAFTCVAVPNSITWAGAKPVFVDIDDSFNLDPIDVEKKITSKTKAIIVQHTFGVPAKMDSLIAFAKKNKLFLIEDCAHSLGATYNEKKVGTIGDAAFFSFGRDKVVSSVWGGVAIINDKCQMTNVKLKLREFQEKLSMPGYLWILQQLLHPILFSPILASYNIMIGKILLEFLKRMRIISIPVYREEKTGARPKDFPAAYPNALAKLLLVQLEKLERYTKQRKETVAVYMQALKTKKHITSPAFRSESAYLRYPILVENPDELRKKAKRKGILLGNWYHHVIDPDGVSLEKIGYVQGSCPKAEYAAARIINLPTRISPDQAKRVIDSLS